MSGGLACAAVRIISEGSCGHGVSDHEVVDRRRIQLIEPGVSGALIHDECRRLDAAATAALVAKARASVARLTSATMTSSQPRCPRRSCRSRFAPGRSTSLTTSPSSVARHMRPGPTPSCIARSSPSSHTPWLEVHQYDAEVSDRSALAGWESAPPTTSCKTSGKAGTTLDQGSSDRARRDDRGRLNGSDPRVAKRRQGLSYCRLGARWSPLEHSYEKLPIPTPSARRSSSTTPARQSKRPGAHPSGDDCHR